MIRLIASDLDGTVLGPDFRFRPRTVEALQAAQDAGILVVFVTGRPYRWLDPVREQLGHDSVAICSNGAVVYDIGQDRILESETLPGAVVLELQERFHHVLPSPVFSVETLAGVVREPGWGETNVVESGEFREGPLPEVLEPAAEVIKFLVRDDAMPPRDLVEAVREVTGEEVSVTHSIASLPLAEIGQKGLSKGRTLSRWCADRDISPQEVAAFGDMPNDTAMLCWAGEGYAMASGWPEVIQAVGRTCPPFEEDGVAQTIEDILIREEADSPAPPGSTRPSRTARRN